MAKDKRLRQASAGELAREWARRSRVWPRVLRPLLILIVAGTIGALVQAGQLVVGAALLVALNGAYILDRILPR
jgi:hypothetical protein